MNKIMRRIMTVATTLALTMALCVPVLGAELKTTELEIYQGVNLYVNCTSYRAADVTGAETKPFIYEGTTYVPLRALSAMLGATLEWDGVNKRVNISSLYTAQPVNDTAGRSDTAFNKTTVTAYEGVEIYVDGNRFIPTDVNGNEVAVYLIDGTTYVPVRALTTLYSVNISYDQDTGRVYIGVQPGQVEAEGDQTLVYPYLSAEVNERIQLYKDCIEAMEPVFGLMLSRQSAYAELKALANTYIETVRTMALEALKSGDAVLSAQLEAKLAGLIAVQDQISELNSYLNLMAVRFTDCVAYIENIPNDVRQEELNSKMLYEVCGWMLDSGIQERGRMAQIADLGTIQALRASLEAAMS